MYPASCFLHQNTYVRTYCEPLLYGRIRGGKSADVDRLGLTQSIKYSLNVTHRPMYIRMYLLARAPKKTVVGDDHSGSLLVLFCNCLFCLGGFIPTRGMCVEYLEYLLQEVHTYLQIERRCECICVCMYPTNQPLCMHTCMYFVSSALSDLLRTAYSNKVPTGLAV